MVSTQTLVHWWNNLTDEYKEKYIEEYNIDIKGQISMDNLQELYDKVVYVKQEE